MDVKAQTISWPRCHYYHCSACNWAAPQADFDVEPERCPRCDALYDELYRLLDLIGGNFSTLPPDEASAFADAWEDDV